MPLFAVIHFLFTIFLIIVEVNLKVFFNGAIAGLLEVIFFSLDLILMSCVFIIVTKTKW